jgi:hypothetical protein
VAHIETHLDLIARQTTGLTDDGPHVEPKTLQVRLDAGEGFEGSFLRDHATLS